MSIFTALAIYFIIWWVVLFTVLPFGIRSQAEHGTLCEPAPSEIRRPSDSRARRDLDTTVVATCDFRIVFS